MQVEKDKVIGFHYTLIMNSGKIMDSTVGSKPKYIIVGHNQIISEFENALMGMKVGDKKKIKVELKDAYGVRDENLIMVIPRNRISNDINLREGLILKKRNKYGQQMKAVVKSYNKNKVVLDLNHPLAEQNFNFVTEIVNIRTATSKELKDGHVI